MMVFVLFLVAFAGCGSAGHGDKKTTPNTDIVSAWDITTGSSYVNIVILNHLTEYISVR